MFRIYNPSLYVDDNFNVDKKYLVESNLNNVKMMFKNVSQVYSPMFDS